MICDRTRNQRARRNRTRQAIDAAIADAASWTDDEVRIAIEWLQSRRVTPAVNWPSNSKETQ